MAFVHARPELVTASRDRLVVWDLLTCQVARQWSGQTLALAVHPYDPTFAVAGRGFPGNDASQRQFLEYSSSSSAPLRSCVLAAPALGLVYLVSESNEAQPVALTSQLSLVALTPGGEADAGGARIRQVREGF